MSKTLQAKTLGKEKIMEYRMQQTNIFSIVESLLKIPTVRIKNIAGTTDKLQKIIQDGRCNLHFISGKYQNL
jgi:hypothetical protein